jgi:hypothetical protein
MDRLERKGQEGMTESGLFRPFRLRAGQGGDSQVEILKRLVAERRVFLRKTGLPSPVKGWEEKEEDRYRPVTCIGPS